MSIDLNKFDFGFTAVDENELDAVQKSASKLETTSTKAEDLENYYRIPADNRDLNYNNFFDVGSMSCRYLFFNTTYWQNISS